MKKIFLTLMLLTAVSLTANNAMLSTVQNTNNTKESLKLIKKIERSNSKNKQLYLCILYHNLSNKSKEEINLNKALTICDNEYQKSKNPLALGYYGSALTIQGKFLNNQKKYLESAKKVEKGFELIDLAVYKMPELVDLHILRLVNGVSVAESSPFKGRFEIVRKDISFLNKVYAKLSNNAKATYHLYYGKVNLHDNKINKAIQNFKLAKKIAPGSKAGKNAAKRLWELEE